MKLSTMFVRLGAVAISMGALTMGDVFAADPIKVTKPGTVFKPGVQPTIVPPVKTVPVTPPVSSTPDTPRLGVVGRAKPTGGFWISSVLANTPAADIGLESGDLIVSVNGFLINSNDALGSALDDAQANSNGHITMIVQDSRGTGLLQIDADLMQELVVKGFAPGAPGALGAANQPAKFRAKNIQKKVIKN